MRRTLRGKRLAFRTCFGENCAADETDLQSVVHPVSPVERAVLLAENGSQRQLAGGLFPTLRQIQLEDQTSVNESARALAARCERGRSEYLHAVDRRAGT